MARIKRQRIGERSGIRRNQLKARINGENGGDVVKRGGIKRTAAT